MQLGRSKQARFAPSLQAVCLAFVLSTQKGCDFFFFFLKKRFVIFSLFSSLDHSALVELI